MYFLSDSTDDAFKVRVGQDADFDDLKNAITDKTGERVKYIFSANDNTQCNPQDPIPQVLANIVPSYYYTIVSPAMPPQAGKN
jgi:hypothetical protein